MKTIHALIDVPDDFDALANWELLVMYRSAAPMTCWRPAEVSIIEQPAQPVNPVAKEVEWRDLYDLAKQAADAGSTCDYDLKGNPITHCDVMVAGPYSPFLLRLINLALKKFTPPSNSARTPDQAIAGEIGWMAEGAPASSMSDDQLLNIARDIGLRQLMHGVRAQEARIFLRLFIDAVAAAPQAPALPDIRIQEMREFIAGIAMQKPEKPDYWSSCSQCEHNISAAEEIFDRHTDKAQAPAIAATITCRHCGGNDKDVPCAYPSDGAPGCLRDQRLYGPQPITAEALPVDGTALPTDRAAHWIC